MTPVHRLRCRTCGEGVAFETNGVGGVVEVRVRDGKRHKCKRQPPAPQRDERVRGRRLTDDDEATILRLRRAGSTYDEIRARTGTSYGAITRVLRQHGLLTRKNGGLKR